MEVKNNYRTRRKWNWEVEIEYVSFPNERRRERSYDLYVESILNAYRNRMKKGQGEAIDHRTQEEVQSGKEKLAKTMTRSRIGLQI